MKITEALKAKGLSQAPRYRWEPEEDRILLSLPKRADAIAAYQAAYPGKRTWGAIRAHRMELMTGHPRIEYVRAARAREKEPAQASTTGS